MTTQRLTVRTALAVDDLYERLWNTAPPQTTTAERDNADRARTAARACGWLPPLAWDDIDTDPERGSYATACPSDPDDPDDLDDLDDLDEIAIDRAVAGDGVHLDDLTSAEQAEVIRQLTRRGKSLRDIADILHTTTRTVSRRRALVA
jgi:DNA-directed RNA polymerase specialized sigma24 family protein